MSLIETSRHLRTLLSHVVVVVVELVAEQPVDAHLEAQQTLRLFKQQACFRKEQARHICANRLTVARHIREVEKMWCQRGNVLIAGTINQMTLKLVICLLRAMRITTAVIMKSTTIRLTWSLSRLC